ncbi:hypothetical protein BN59_01608 [Legionella massiliensis]|uniref:Uncharacterized protein n=1 Tax=Legionella massiliensis TaxID=1034943 RepID=A0A078KS78_9GAMM|nr:hypothetical protein [Legionella massiliensis]CDZ77325.1 hypothetical protein BN59_01608 [Legionella massiliensis]CEE13063.1 hypothetical protein BN1094_01608 [Legionella massiliensis]
MMKKKILSLLPLIFMLLCQLAYAKDDVGRQIEAKLDKAATNLMENKDIPQSWQLMVEVSQMLKVHPEYNDGEIAEGIADVLTTLLTKPWKYANPYFTGKNSMEFNHFVLDHINEIYTVEDLKTVKKNIMNGCNQEQFTICKQLITKINDAIALQP